MHWRFENKDKFYSKYIKKEGNKYYFKSFIHYNKEIIGKDGRSILFQGVVMYI